MSLPIPESPLTDACTVIHDNILYAYSPEAFQSLPLRPGAKWTTLAQGEKVKGGVCVGSTPKDSSAAAFFVVGGKGTTAGYQGLQKYTFSTRKWEIITMVQPVVQDRLWHGAAYIKISDSLLVYSGAQDGTTGLSSQTFTILSQAPYSVEAFPSTAPPVNKPLLLPWSDKQVVLVGGSTTNSMVMLFDGSQKQWIDSGASLAHSLPKASSAVQATLINGDDGSKIMYTFDLSVAPNQVQRTVLLQKGGTPQQAAEPISRRSEQPMSGLEKRQPLTLDDWPAYNSSLAPTTTRSNFALASDGKGLVVITGGGSPDLSIFDAREDAWRDPATLLVAQKAFSTSSTPNSIPTLETGNPLTETGHNSALRNGRKPTLGTGNEPTLATGNVPTAAPFSPTLSSTIPSISSSTPTPTAVPDDLTSPEESSTDDSDALAVAVTNNDGISTNTILGASLGSIFGLAIVLLILHWWIKRCRKRREHAEAGHNRRASGASTDEKGASAYATDGYPQPPAGNPYFRGHQLQESQSSYSSMAILMGKMNHPSPTRSTHDPGHKRLSGGSMLKNALKKTISKPIPSPFNPSAPPAYGEHAIDQKNMAHGKGLSPARPRHPADAAMIDAQSNSRRSSGWNRYWSGGSALNILGFGGGNQHGNGNGNGTGNENHEKTPNYSRRDTVDSVASLYSDGHRVTQDSATVPPLQVYDTRASFSKVKTGSPTIAYFNNQQGMSGKIESYPGSGQGEALGTGVPSYPWNVDDKARPHGREPTPSGYTASVYTAAAHERPVTQLPPTGVSIPPQLPEAAMPSDMSWFKLGANNHDKQRR